MPIIAEWEYADAIVVINPDGIEAVALLLLYVHQMEMMKKYRYLCGWCGVPMVERMMLRRRGYMMVPYLQCPLRGCTAPMPGVEYE